MTPDWYICIASGPSLERKDTEALRGVGPTIAVNCAVFFAPWADILFAADSVWYRHYGPKLVPWFKGRKVSRTHKGPGVEQWRGVTWQRTGGNSGHMAIQYAVDQGAKKIALLGYDQSKAVDGKAHFHADHPKRTRQGARTNLANAGGITAWPRMMTKTSLELRDRGVEVVNLSRQTALRCFKRQSVEDFLEKLNADHTASS
jgi:hypothetical protein